MKELKIFRDLARRWKDKEVLREWVVNKRVIKWTGKKELKEDNKS